MHRRSVFASTRPPARTHCQDSDDRTGAHGDLWYGQADFSPRPGDSGPQMVLESSVYELAKLGYLWLNRGRWKNTRIFSEDYFREATTDWSPDTGNTEFGYYGHYGFWW